jgi:STE24 endopeptidase
MGVGGNSVNPNHIRFRKLSEWGMALRLFLLLAISFVAAAQPAAPPPAESRREVKEYSLPPDKLAKAIEYADARNRLHFAGVAWTLLALAGILAARLAPRYRDLAERVSRWRIVQAYLFGMLLVLTLDILTLPISVYAQHLARKYEQSIQGWSSWLWDWTKGEAIGVALTGFLIWILYWSIRRSPARWWFYFWLATIPLLLFMMLITPLVIEPMFNRFTPLANTQPQLVSEIQKVVARGGLDIPPDRMFEMNASEKTKSINAYVTGIGASKRVVVWDTAIRKMTTAQTLFVFGHEMGHYVLGHIWNGIIAACFGGFVFLFLCFHTMRWAIRRWGGRWQIRGVEDWASLPVLALALTLFGFFSEPVESAFSRWQEHNADIYGLEVIHGIVPDAAQAAAVSFQVLGETALSDPHPSAFIRFWLYDHPPLAERLSFAAQYDPWSNGQSPKYVR